MAGTSLPGKPRLLYLVLCDTFTTDSFGKKTLVGTFDRVTSSVFPCLARPFHIVTGWEGLEGDYAMTVEIQDVQGKRVFSSPKIGLRFSGPLQRADAIIQVSGLKLENPGVHSVLALLEGSPQGSHPLLVEKSIGLTTDQEKVA
ncbi:MAG: hypothetical protein HY594_03840 [Candidatus Omnitrophica bacterium]|nr:hypothetical protein [Candidatus Omnitrophota bacterium]